MASDAGSGSPPPESEEARESALIRRAQRGDRDAFNAIMILYRERIVRLAYHMAGNREEAQDLCQETFIKAFRALGSFDARRPFSPWLYRIAHNVTLDHIRRRKARPALVESDPEFPFEERMDQTAENPQRTLLSKETQKEMMAAIQSLPENYRSVVVFRYLEDLSYAEIAAALNLTEANVMMRMSRARRMLKDKLKHLHAED
jgi:RNA polymerase sigma-70 factor (ECF subfamily)